MNHSIYSADRSTHLKIVVVALVAGIAVAAFGISARTQFGGLHADRTCHQGGQAGDRHQFEHVVGPLKGICEFTRLFTSPPKLPRGYVEDPTTPSRLRKRPLPTGVFFLWDCM